MDTRNKKILRAAGIFAAGIAAGMVIAAGMFLLTVQTFEPIIN